MSSKDTNAKVEMGKVQGRPTVKFDDTGITNVYANVCNASSSREEVMLEFGVKNVLKREASEVRVKLSNRVILSPFAAKRLALLLVNVVKQYESRFGVMNVGAMKTAANRPPAK